MRHNWEIVDSGEYDSIYQCSLCKKRHLYSADNLLSKPPELGCVPGTREIAKEVNRLFGEIAKSQSQIGVLQSLCTHPNVVKKHGSNTGNYDPTCDCYWTDFNCPDCKKRWQMEGSL